MARNSRRRVRAAGHEMRSVRVAQPRTERCLAAQGDFGTPIGDVYYFPKDLPGSFAAPSPSLPGVVLFFPRSSQPH